MTFNKARILAEGGKFYGDDNPLDDRYSMLPKIVEERRLSVTESTDKEKIPSRFLGQPLNLIVLEGPVQKADTWNGNGRNYPMPIWQKHVSESSDLQQRIARKGVFGHVEHPASGASNLNEVAIRIDKIWMVENVVMGRITVLNTFPGGWNVRALVESGSAVGISSRGTGTVDAQGYIQEDYVPWTWDIVDNPSTPGAFLEPVTESQQKTIATPVTETTIDDNRINPMSGNKPSISETISALTGKVNSAVAVKLTKENEATFRDGLLTLRREVVEAFPGPDATLPEVVELVTRIDTARRAPVPAPLNAEHAGLVEQVAATLSSQDTKVRDAAAKAIKEALDGNERLKELIREALEAQTVMTAEQEASAAIVSEMTARLKADAVQIKDLEARLAESAAVIADLHSQKAVGTVAKPTVAESQTEPPQKTKEELAEEQEQKDIEAVRKAIEENGNKPPTQPVVPSQPPTPAEPTRSADPMLESIAFMQSQIGARPSSVAFTPNPGNLE